MNRLYHYINLLNINLLLIVLHVYVFFTPKKTIINKKIAFLPYTPSGWYGGDIRIANWKKYFEAEGYQVDVLWAWNKEEMSRFDHSGWLDKYIIYSKISYRRFKCFFKLFNYQSIWIQRAFVPAYPFKRGVFERLLKKSGLFWVVDFYDPDYRHNPDFVHDVALSASKVTVVNQYLKDYFDNVGCKSVSVINLTVEDTNYICKTDYSWEDKFVIGWMGSEFNTFELINVKESLRSVQAKYPFVQFQFICNHFDGIEGLAFNVVKWHPDTFYKQLSGFDLGIVPISYKENDYLKGKVAMKSIELMAAGIPIVCSPYGVSNALADEVNALFVFEEKDWIEKIGRMIEDENLRKRLGVNARSVFENEHTYKRVFPPLLSLMTNQ